MAEEPKSSENEASVTVTVDRNKNAPVFRDAERYQKTILETLGEGNDVFRVTVEDRDRVVRGFIEKNSITLIKAVFRVVPYLPFRSIVGPYGLTFYYYMPHGITVRLFTEVIRVQMND